MLEPDPLGTVDAVPVGPAGPATVDAAPVGPLGRLATSMIVSVAGWRVVVVSLLSNLNAGA